tara:strand:+ start:415 stop:810 length:396 start_codon:yes stop_codon:yes gene_type:complete
MSNESENKIIYDPIVGTFYNKIDLTRFEGHTKGEWCIDDGNLMVRTDEISVLLAEPYWDDGITGDEDTINKKLMISGPDLLAELKRCYANIEWLEKTADLATDYIGEIHHSHWDIFEERMFAAGLWERPSE